MAWETPKTDWYGGVDTNGNYVGDRFNAVDFNRIKNNIDVLHGMAMKLYEDFDIVSIGDDRTAKDFFYADEINQLEENLNIINDNTIKGYYGESPIYLTNGHTMTFGDLNRLEGAILDLRDKLENELSGLRSFTWCFGMKGGEL